MTPYNIKAHPTKYNGVLFRSRLEARWAAFFDLAGWKWEYEPLDLVGWSPDFRVAFACNHSECGGGHALLVEIKPYYTIDDFTGHPCLEYPFGLHLHSDSGIPASASAAFGNNPTVTEWEMCHGHGGGVFDVPYWVENAAELWKEAGNITQYKHVGR